MRYARTGIAVGVLLLLSACGTLTAPSQEAGFMLSAAVSTVPGVAFLPPIGPEVPTLGFFRTAVLDVEIYEADASGQPKGGQLGPSYSTSDGTVRVEPEGFYMALWRVSATVAAHRSVERVVVQVWGSALDASLIECEDRCLLGSFQAVIKKSRKAKMDGALDLTRSQTLPIKVFVPGVAGVPDSIGGLVTVSTGERFDVEDGFGDPIIENCIVNDFTMPGQGLNALGAGLNALGAGLNALGAVGGLFLLAPGTNPDAEADIRLALPSEAGDLVGSLTSIQQSLRVAIPTAALLVVDDFSTTSGLRYLVPESLTEPLDSFGKADLEAAVGADLSHGALVLHQVLAMVEAGGWTLDPEMSAWNGSFRVYYRFLGQFRQDLVVAAVDTGGFDTDLVATRIQNALNTLLALEFDGDVMDAFGFSLDVRRVIVNMSFAIVPCAILYDYEAFVNDSTTFQDYVEALADANGLQAFRDELTQLVVEPLGGAADPIGAQVVGDFYSCGDVDEEDGWQDESLSVWEWFVMNPPDRIRCWDYSDSHEAVNYVASSGNFGLPFPMFPAAWPFVLGVSAQNAEETVGFASTKAAFANDGEVMAPGALFELGRSEADASGASKVVLAYAGTSFAAPVVSLFAALDAVGGPYGCALPSYSKLTDYHANPSEPNANVDLATATLRCFSGGMIP